MSAETALATLLRINLITAAAIVLILVLRAYALRFLGAGSAYRLWIVVPLAVAAAFLPARTLPLGCSWTSRGANVVQRIKLLAQPSPTWRSVLGGATAVLLLSFGVGYAAWAQQVPNVARPESVWTAVGDKWQGILSHQLEAKRHDSFIKRAQQGNIDLVFFGTTDTEMFSWPDRGRPEFERAFANIHAANFGSQGTSPKSLLWRMQHGELDGYEAKLIVFQFWGIGDLVNPDDEERLKGLAPLLAEIEARQLRARILLSAPFPRGFNSRDAWQRISTERATHLANHVDNQRVFYTDIGARFYKSDGAHDTSLWSRSYIAETGVGAHPNAFKVWAEELQPWLDRFVR